MDEMQLFLRKSFVNPESCCTFALANKKQTLLNIAEWSSW